MERGNPRSTASIAGHPIHPMLVPFPIAFLASAPVSDIVFWAGGEPGWATVSLWLLGAGVVTVLAAALFGFTDFLGDRRIRSLGAAAQHMIGNLAAVLLALFNWYLRYAGGAAEGVFPYGIWLSLATALLLVFNGWKGWEMVYRHHVGVAEEPAAPARQSGRTVEGVRGARGLRSPS
ncbi:DUF2231 domain-containing protein [Marinimicrococcus flavescens]|uniref:DUF2231 domain-containing protein n=1 Tax=Marinimicrococcus flavescens TaxID=3031815 RepID=A0AAP3XSJ7_9PROT|nr:DUF2231 domain-containing protein [Marinimicrococcus flavescens]